MRNFLLIILTCLVLAGPVLAATFPCSGDSSEGALTCTGCENMGIISIKSVPTSAGITINPGQNTSYTGISTVSMGQDPGTHSFVVSLSGYSDYTGQYQICSKKVTYVTVELTKAPPVTFGKTRLSGTIALQPVTSLPTTTITTVPVTAGSTNQPAPQQPAGTSTPQDNLGALSVTTTPAGAFIFIDGVQRGVSPATIPGLSAGTHTVLLKLDGYQDLSTPVTIAAGKTQDYATSLVKNAAAVTTPAATENATATPKKGIAPGFEFALALVAMGAIIVLRILS